VEVNPRYSASIEVLERVMDVHFIGLHVAACEVNALPTESIASTDRFAGKAVVYARKNGVVPSALDSIVSQWNQPGETPVLADLPRIGEVVRRGQPVVTVLTEGNSLVDVEAQLRHRVKIVEQLLTPDSRLRTPGS
jgi:predicted ATP-grasp superfamily ATP-dependent carboligase